VRIQIPESAVKPQPKPGWTLDLVKAKYAKAYDYYGTPMTEGVKEIIWTGKLLDENYDEFVFGAYLTDSLKPGEMLYFPTVQECEKGEHRWIEIPAEGKKADDYKEPAPGLKLLPPSDELTNVPGGAVGPRGSTTDLADNDQTNRQRRACQRRHHVQSDE
jgi:uncharacterized protein YcnI